MRLADKTSRSWLRAPTNVRFHTSRLWGISEQLDHARVIVVHGEIQGRVVVEFSS